MLDAPRARCAEIEILASERPIDTKRRACALARGHYGELHVLDHIPGDKHSRTLRHARPKTKAALSPAGPAPTMTTS